jgi:hypothetical protein
MKDLLHKAREHAFVASVSIAAFTHSSWSLATVFSGHEPATFGLAWLGWIVPAALIAASIDIGLLSLAAQIKRRQERTVGRVLSFVLLCAGMFALQGLYVASHMPVIPLGAGVRPDWVATASLFRDSMLIVVPGLLPLALILHTISGADSGADGTPSEPERGAILAVTETETEPEPEPKNNTDRAVTETESRGAPNEVTHFLSPNGNHHKPF